MKEAARGAAPVFSAPDPGREVVKKEIISAKTGKPVTRAGGKKKVIFRYTYGDLSTWESPSRIPTQAEIKLFKAVKTLKQAGIVDDPEALEPEAGKRLIFSKVVEIRAGDPKMMTARDAVTQVIGDFTFPKDSVVELLIFWRVYADAAKTQVLEAPPSVRYLIDTKKMYQGYSKMLQTFRGWMLEDLAEKEGMDIDEIKEEIPGRIKKWMEEKKRRGIIPKSSTISFIEKKILDISKGRGVYISDKSKFKDYHGPKGKGKKRRKESPFKAQALVSDLGIKIWLVQGPKPKPKPKKKTGKKKKKAARQTKTTARRPTKRQPARRPAKRKAARRPAKRQPARRPAKRKAARRPAKRQPARRPVKRKAARRPVKRKAKKR